MPTPVIDSLAKRSGKSKEEVEKKWEKSKDIVKDNYPDVEVDSEQYYKIVTGVLKNMLGLSESFREFYNR